MGTAVRSASRGVVAVVVAVSVCAAGALLDPSAASGRATGDTVLAARGSTDPAQVGSAFIEAWNAQRMDELRALLAEDIVLLAPGHAPLRGPDDVVAFCRRTRPLVGGFRPTVEVHKVVRDRNLYTRAVTYVLDNGMQTNDIEVIARQPDGTWRFTLFQTGIRGPLR